MARQALVAIQTRPMTLVALTEQIQAAVDPHGWTVAIAREGDALVVDLVGPVCPDPLLAMMILEAELERSDKTGLEAVKLYGHCLRPEAAGEPDVLAQASPGWMSVIDLNHYFSQRAALSPEAFGLAGAEASRMACEAERDRYSNAVIAAATDSSIALEAKPAAPVDLPVDLIDPILETEPPAPMLGLSSEGDGISLESEDPWEVELPQEQAAAVSLSLDRFPRISTSSGGRGEDDQGRLAEPSEQPASLQPKKIVEVSEVAQRPVRFTVPAGQAFRSTAAQSSKAQVATQTLAPLTGYDRYRSFITEQSSWFAQTVKDNPRLYALAKQRQHYTIGTLSHYLMDTLAEHECLMDLVPVRKRDRGCGLIFTDQRVMALSQPGRRNRQGLQVWMVPWSWVHKVEICHDSLRFHYGRAQERFNVDLEAPYHLRNAIPRDIPVRIVRQIESSQQRALDTKAGLAMVAGVMFALGSGFSLLNKVIDRQQIEARSSNPLAGSRSAIQADAPSQQVSRSGQNAPVPAESSSVAAPLVMTTSHEQCVNSFNNAAQPHAYATLNQVTQTLQVNLQNQVLLQMSQQQFDQTAASVAQEILSSCQAKAISQVVVTNGSLRYQQQRSAIHINPVKSEDELNLF